MTTNTTTVSDIDFIKTLTEHEIERKFVLQNALCERSIAYAAKNGRNWTKVPCRFGMHTCAIILDRIKELYTKQGYEVTTTKNTYGCRYPSYITIKWGE